MSTSSPFFKTFSQTSARPDPLLLFQQITRCQSVFSCFSPPFAIHCRLVATERVATREPLFVLRTSGSAPKFPISWTLLRLRLTTTSERFKRVGPKGATHYINLKSFCQPKIRHLYQSIASRLRTIASSTGRR